MVKYHSQFLYSWLRKKLVIASTSIDGNNGRNGSFEPQIIEKRQTRTDDIETRVLAMYAKRMSTRDIEDHLKDIYGIF